MPRLDLSITAKCDLMIAINFVTPDASAKLKLLYNKLATVVSLVNI